MIVPVVDGEDVDIPILTSNDVRELTLETIKSPLYKELSAPEIFTLSNARMSCESPKVTVAIPVTLLYVNVEAVYAFPVRNAFVFTVAVTPTPVVDANETVDAEATWISLVLEIPVIL